MLVIPPGDIQGAGSAHQDSKDMRDALERTVREKEKKTASHTQTGGVRR